MKKLYMLLIVAIFATAAVNATVVQTTPTISDVCTYTATVICAPTISCEGDGSLGTFLPNTNNNVMSADPLVWSINGDALLTYHITVSNAPSYYSVGTTVAASGGSSVLYGDWSFLAADGEADDFVTPTTWKADHAGVGDDPGSGGDINCGNGEDGSGALRIFFRPTMLTTDAPSTTTVESFSLTVSVYASF